MSTLPTQRCSSKRCCCYRRAQRAAERAEDWKRFVKKALRLKFKGRLWAFWGHLLNAKKAEGKEPTGKKKTK